MTLTTLNFAGTTLHFGQINIIHGANGTGKTTLLSAVAQAVLEQEDQSEAGVSLPCTGKGDGHDRLALYREALEKANGDCLLTVDTPEAYLGAKLQREAALLFVQAAHDGVQLFIATHSLFFMRELELLALEDRAKGLSLRWRFFGLHRAGDELAITQADDVDDTGEIEHLEENLIQSDKYLSTDWEAAK